MSDLANELRALCADECRNRIDYRCVVCRGADAVDRLAEAEKLLREAREGNGHTPDWWRRVDATLKAAKGGE